jgi:hypothetical protein
MRIATPFLLLLLVAVAGACAEPPNVVQGVVVSYDKESRIVVLDDEARPGQTMELSLAGAEIGAEPAVGDTLRVAYRDVDGKHRATRVMNISRQAELGGKKGGSSGGH